MHNVGDCDSVCVEDKIEEIFLEKHRLRMCDMTSTSPGRTYTLLYWSERTQ